MGVMLTFSAVGVDPSRGCCWDGESDGDDQIAASKAGTDWMSIEKGEEALDSVHENTLPILLNIC